MTNTDGNLSALRERELATDADIALADARAREQLEEALARIADLEKEVSAWKDRNEKNKTVAANATVLASDRGFEIESLNADLAAEKALAADLDGGLLLAQDIIEAASKLLTKKAGTKWGLWYLDRISELRAAYCKARGM